MTANLSLIRASGGKLENKTLALQFLNSLATATVICKGNLASAKFYIWRSILRALATGGVGCNTQTFET